MRVLNLLPMKNLLAKSVSITVLACLTLILSNCKEEEAPAPVPEIASFSPEAGIEGSTITITGANFSAILDENIVKFNGTQATVTAASITSLTVGVPSGAATGKISVTVKGQTGTSVNNFSVLGVPTITNFSPEAGAIGATVTINGTKFSAVAGENTVTFNGTAATVSAATATSLSVTVPSGATTGKISVTVNGLVATSAENFIILEPVITSFSPEYGLPGTTISITGNNFSTVPANNIVKINGKDATVVNASKTQLTITVPEGSSSGKITVSFAERTAESASDFEVLKDIPRSGLVAFYPFKGNANDIAGNDLHGTVNGATLSTDRFGKANQAYSFDGTNDYIDMGNPTGLQISNKITVAGWVNIDDFKAGNNSMSIFTKIYFDPNAGGNPKKGYWIYQNFTGNQTPMFSAVAFNSGGLGLSSYVGKTVTTDKWIFIALTIDNTSWKFYMDGEATHSGTIANNVMDDGSLGDLNIGRYGGGFFFDGLIDDLTIYNRALSDSEVIQVFEQTVTKY